MNKTFGEMKRYQLTKEIRKKMNLKDLSLPWGRLCNASDFDSFASCFAFGVQWQNPNMRTMPVEFLRFALFSITNFPKGSRPTEPEREGFF